MVSIYGFIDIIIKRSALDKNSVKNSRHLIEREKTEPYYYDDDLICIPGGMSPYDAEMAAKWLEREYEIQIFDMTDPMKPVAKDAVIINSVFGPTVKCPWINKFPGDRYALKHEATNKNIYWDNEKWLSSFKKASEARDRNALHNVREAVFRNTQQIVANGGYRDIELYDPPVSTVFSEEITGLKAVKYSNHQRIIKVLNEDCLETARRLESRNPLVLNMANRRTPGGGVEYGAGAQEECLFRSSNYYRTLYRLRDSYPMDRNYGGIYSPLVTVFRGLEADGYPLLDKPFITNFVAVAALNRPSLDEHGNYTESERCGMENKIRTILNIAVMYNHRVLILSAFGCGAFKNPPEQVAKLFKQILDEPLYKESFDEIYFSIKPDHNDKLTNNFKSFQKVFD